MPAKKTASLTSGLVAVKGAAAPASDMTARAAPVAAKADEGEPNGQPLNFRVPASFRREFRTFAAQNDLKLNELLRLSFEAYKLKAG